MSERINKPQYTEKTEGARGPASQGEGVPDTAQFMAAHMAARGSGYNEYGSYTGPTTPGQFGSSPMFPASSNEQAYIPGEPTMVTHATGSVTAYPWPDATGGGTMGAQPGWHTNSGSEGSPMTGPGGDQR